MFETVDAPVVESLKETITHSNVAPYVVTSLAQSDAQIETTHDNPHKEYESKLVSGSDNSQQKVVTDDEKHKVSDGEKEKIVSGDDKNNGSEREDDVITCIKNDSLEKEDDKVVPNECENEKDDENRIEEEENAGGYGNEERKGKESSGVDKD